MKRTAHGFFATVLLLAVSIAPVASYAAGEGFVWREFGLGVTTQHADGQDSDITDVEGQLSYALNSGLYVLGGLGYPMAQNTADNMFDPSLLYLKRIGVGVKGNANSMFDFRTGFCYCVNDDKQQELAPLWQAGSNSADVFGAGTYHLSDRFNLGGSLSLGHEGQAVGLFGGYRF